MPGWLSSMVRTPPCQDHNWRRGLMSHNNNNNNKSNKLMSDKICGHPRDRPSQVGGLWRGDLHYLHHHRVLE